MINPVSVSEEKAGIARQRIVVQGIVQGVGFRPFVYRLATNLALTGYVCNNSAGVIIEIEGEPDLLSRFRQSLQNEAPPLAHIDAIMVDDLPLNGDSNFVIDYSQAQLHSDTLVAPDVATCDDCVRELLDVAGRRYRYPFINCTNCGPRFTIVQDAPYDREKTTMQAFPMCPACVAEYENPLDRRFHAQPNACPICGPHTELVEPEWTESSSDSEPLIDSLYPGGDEIGAAAKELAAGRILAIKGLGGYHLACDAFNETAVAQLRERKRRLAKPFALMVRSLDEARRLCKMSETEATLLQSRRRPILLLRQEENVSLASDVAPRHNTLGIMLPYTPLHELLLRDFAACVEAGRPAVLVMTSGNISDEPIAYQNAQAHRQLASIADAWLDHNRPIHMRCDDSIVRVAAGGEQILRRSRGYVPEPIALPLSCPVPILACGGQLKNTFCLGKEARAFVSHHIGDLDNLETLTSFQEGIEHFQHLFDIQPQAVAFDLHPQYMATKHAHDLHAQNPHVSHAIGIQHHHAHIASVLAEHGLKEPVIGIAADGTGYGVDGAVWGGEVLVADLETCKRWAHLSYVPLVGGEQAIRQPWRVAAVYLHQTHGDEFLGLDIDFTRALNRQQWQVLAQMMAKDINSPPTSSLGRLFDAVAALLGVRETVTYEGQAAIELEMLSDPSDESYPFAITAGSPAQLDVRPTISAIVEDLQANVPGATIAGRFHRTVAELLAAACVRVREQTGITRVALSGGVFQNHLLLEQLLAMLAQKNFHTYINRIVPPNDGGLSLGQLAVAAARLSHSDQMKKDC